MQTILELAKGHDAISSALKYVLHHNKSHSAPYHNFYHLCCVAESAHELASLYCSDRAIELTIAGLFHDFDHSQGKYPDNVNIKMALEGFSMWKTQYSGPEIDDMLIERCIVATQFPYIVPNETFIADNFVAGLIIRDADMMQCLYPNWIQHVLFGLGQEFNKDFFEMVEAQIVFLDGLQPNTEKLKEIWTEKKPEVIKALRLLQTYKEL